MAALIVHRKLADWQKENQWIRHRFVHAAPHNPPISKTHRARRTFARLRGKLEGLLQLTIIQVFGEFLSDLATWPIDLTNT